MTPDQRSPGGTRGVVVAGRQPHSAPQGTLVVGFDRDAVSRASLLEGPVSRRLVRTAARPVLVVPNASSARRGRGASLFRGPLGSSGNGDRRGGEARWGRTVRWWWSPTGSRSTR